jgi:uncharacterized membrane protein
MSALQRNMLWLAAALAIAAAAHFAAVVILPHVIMQRTMAGIARRAGLVNHMLYGKRPSAASRGVVRPSPDLLYASCVFDLAKTGGLWVQAHDMPATYWSISVFDADTNNFYVVDDRQAKGARVQFLIVAPDWDKPMPYTLVHAPTMRGLVLVRTLIDDESKVAQIDAARRNVTCAAYGAIAPWPPEPARP